MCYARQSIAKGVCGEVFGMNVVRVPKSYLPEGVYFLVAHKGRGAHAVQDRGREGA
ncbi:MAG: hypothetical protein ACLR4Z_04335 [Butyricicoccaceae bacterium]